MPDEAEPDKPKRVKSISDSDVNESVRVKSKINQPIQDLHSLKQTADGLKIQKRKQNMDPPRKISVVKTSDSIKRAKILKNISNPVVQKKQSVRSVLNDVDSLLKSAEEQNLLNDKSNFESNTKESDDVMKELDEIINS